jgi:FkbM family methyltransferase
MPIRASRFPLQRIIRALPPWLRRIKLCQSIAFIAGASYHRVAFPEGELIGNVQDCEVANSLVRASFADYGYFEIARRWLNDGDVHVDVGANYGFHTFGLLRSPVSHRVEYALIDANPDCVGCLAESAKLYPDNRFRIFHLAASEAPGRVNFTFSRSATGGGRVGASRDLGLSEVTVPAAPLDELFAEQKIDSIGLMKMDIEGSERRALRERQKGSVNKY